MSQLVIFGKLKKPILSKTKVFISGASSDELGVSGESVFQILLEKFYDVYSEASFEPVRVEENTIKVNENLMEENKPYAVSYKGKDYLLTRSDGKTKFYELRD